MRLTYKTRNTNKILRLQVTTFLLRYETNLKFFDVSCNLAARQQIVLQEKDLFIFLRIFGTISSADMKVDRELLLTYHSVKNHSCKMWSFIFIGKLRTAGEKKSFPKATLEADSIDKFSLHDSRNCFTGNLWGEV